MKLLSLLIIIPVISWGQVGSNMITTLTLGDSKFELLLEYGSVDDSILFINVHEDETTSIETVEEYSKERAVHFLRIAHQKTRRLTFKIKDREYSVDPNRIYTRKGRRKTLKDGGRFGIRASAKVKFFATYVLDFIENKSVVIAMHNNTDVNYSIKSYLPGGDESQNTAQVHVNEEMDADDFIYTTDLNFYNKFKEMNLNVILQDNKKYVNDGSLSVYCGLKGIPYINIEAQKGHFDEQLELIKSVMSIF